MLRLSEEDHRKVTAAVTEGEASSDAEIVTVVSAQSDSYHDVALHYAVLAMLLVPAIWAILPQSFLDWTLGQLFGWNSALTRPELMALMFIKLTAAFLIVRYALVPLRLRMALTPDATKSRRVRRRAVQFFRIGAERRTVGRTGVLLYLSLAEHRAEIVVDEAILAKVAPDVWAEAMATLVAEVKAGRPGDGMAQTVRTLGHVLAEHFPKTAADRNELPDRLVEL